MPRSAASDLGLHCLAVTRLGVSSLQWVKKRLYFNVNQMQHDAKFKENEFFLKEAIPPKLFCAFLRSLL